MTSIPFAPFAPDINAVDTSFCDVAINVWPEVNGYSPIASLSPLFAPLPDICVGFFTARTKSGQFITYAGTRTNLYRAASDGQSWVLVSKTASSYLVPKGDFWRFAQFGSNLIAVHANDVPQVCNVDTQTDFINLGGSPPIAKGVAIIGDFVVLHRLVSDPQRIQWSDLNNINFWTPGLNLSDYQDFPEGGDVTAVEGGEYGLVFQESSIRRMIFAPGSPEIFQFSRIEERLGAISPHAVIKHGSDIFFRANDGFYLIGSGGVSKPIGANRVNEWFLERINFINIGEVLAVADVKKPRIIWFFKSSSNIGNSLFDTGLIYDKSLDRWSTLEVSIQFAGSASLPVKNVDNLTQSIDSILTSLDSFAFNGGGFAFGAFTFDNRISFLLGAKLPAQIETGDTFLMRPKNSLIKGVRVDTDAREHFVSVSSRFSLSDPVVFGQSSAPEVTEFCPVDQSGRYHRARLNIPSGTNWTYASAIEPDAVIAGGA